MANLKDYIDASKLVTFGAISRGLMLIVIAPLFVIVF